MPLRPAVSLDWSEGRFFDRWMLVHFLSGVAGGFSNAWFELSTPVVFGVALAMMVGWEFGEWRLGVTESLTNIVIDIVVGIAGVGLALAIATRLSRAAEVVAFLITLAVATVGGVLGVMAHRRRSAAN